MRRDPHGRLHFAYDAGQHGDGKASVRFPPGRPRREWAHGADLAEGGCNIRSTAIYEGFYAHEPNTPPGKHPDGNRAVHRANASGSSKV